MFVLISPARNEAKFLPALIASVAAQTIRPKRWVIVSDGSTDGSDDIIAKAMLKFDFIQLVRRDAPVKRSFGAKALAFRAGLECLRDVSFEYIGNLDADITFESDYYARMIDAMNADVRLGVVTGACWDKTDDGFKKVTITENHAVGAVQFFRKDCFEQIGGYQTVTIGGMDSLATLSARMHGWRTRVLMSVPVWHHKPVDSATARNALHSSYRAGLTEYHIGTHPLYAAAKAIRRWRQNPPVLGMFVRLYAYSYAYCLSKHRDSPPELVSYLRNEQLQVLKDAIFGQRRFGDNPETGRL